MALGMGSASAAAPCAALAYVLPLCVVATCVAALVTAELSFLCEPCVTVLAVTCVVVLVVLCVTVLAVPCVVVLVPCAVALLAGPCAAGP